ncbi:sterol desaturase family protein [Actinoplanes sp. CA-015351]|uniref:sterol desaturase family protein n=1 Tax=Actinoplanes sp. CA-015351 TaxID=3239897 RepID=UPI003D97A731
MIPAVLYAVPAFLLLIVMELLSFRFLPDDEERGYEARDTATSLSMGLGSQIIGVPWKLLTAVLFAGLYVLSPLKLDPGDWWVWVLLFFADDVAYYWFHRLHHEVRVFWAGHVVHHSSQFFNFSTALRQSWTPMTALPFWLGLAALGFPPWMIPYLDRNYGGILIVWDRLFGSFEPEGERVRYGLTSNIETYNPLRVATHEYAAIWRDVRSATCWRERAGYLFGRPGWTPAA